MLSIVKQKLGSWCHCWTTELTNPETVLPLGFLLCEIINPSLFKRLTVCFLWTQSILNDMVLSLSAYIPGSKFSIISLFHQQQHQALISSQLSVGTLCSSLISSSWFIIILHAATSALAELDIWSLRGQKIQPQSWWKKALRLFRFST